MRKQSANVAAMVFMVALCAIVFAAGCSFSPLKFASRNACEFLNCDVLFFVDDLLPLSGGPEESGGDAAAAE